MQKGVGGEASVTLTVSAREVTTPASMLPGHEDPAPGAVLDRYMVLEFLGEGSMGRVYRAQDTELGREVALKWIRPGRIDPARAQARLRREAHAMAKVEHAAVVRIYDIGISRDRLFVTMELARGGTLSGWLKARPRGWREVVRVFLEAGRGLAAAHQVGLVHRDVKPGNILLDAHGRAKVSDFGLARGFDREDADADPARPHDELVDASLTRPGAIVGTLPYMAPEQLRGHAIDARADQFGFCVALWEALCGRRPFRVAGDAACRPEAFLQVILAGAIDEGGAGTQVPRRILALVRRGLAADRDQRWASMDELLDALERAGQTRRAWWAAAAAAVGSIAVVAASTRTPSHASLPACGLRDQIAVIWNPGVRARYLSQAQFSDSAREDAGWFDWYARELDSVYAAACSRADTPRLACLDGAVEDLRTATLRAERVYWPRLRALDRCGTTLREVAGAGLNLGNGQPPHLSPDARQLLITGRDRVPVIRQLDGGGSRPLASRLEPLRWLPDGTILGLGDHERLTVIDPSSDRTVRAFDVKGHVIDVSDDLQYVAVFEHDSLEITRIGGGEPLLVHSAGNQTSMTRVSFGRFSPDARRFAWVDGGQVWFHIDDIVGGHRETLKFRLHEYGTGDVFVRWLDTDSVVVNGSSTSGVAGDLWRVRVDATGAVAEPPQILYRAESDTTWALEDVRAGKLLIERTTLATQNFLIDGQSSSLLVSPLSRFHLLTPDRAHRRVLAATGMLRNKWVWMSIDLVTVQPIAALDGLSRPVVTDSGIAALDLRGDVPAYVALDDAGAEVVRAPIEAARGARPTISCATSRCLVMWAAGAGTYSVTIEGHDVGEVTRRDQLDLARVEAWALAPDGNSVVVRMFSSLPNSVLSLYDLEHATLRQLPSEICVQGVQRVHFSPSGELLMTCPVPAQGDLEFLIVRRDMAGHERVQWRSRAWIASMAPIDEDRMIVSTISYQNRLGLFETAVPGPAD